MLPRSRSSPSSSRFRCRWTSSRNTGRSVRSRRCRSKWRCGFGCCATVASWSRRRGTWCRETWSVLSAGDLVPADARLLDADDFFVNEALLTGEPYPVEKRAGAPLADDGAARAAQRRLHGQFGGERQRPRADRRDRTRTQLGGISSDLRREPPPTAFQLGIRDFGFLIVRVTLAAGPVRAAGEPACRAAASCSPSSSPWRWPSV